MLVCVRISGDVLKCNQQQKNNSKAKRGYYPFVPEGDQFHGH